MAFLINPYIYGAGIPSCSGDLINTWNLGGYYKMDGDSSDSSGNGFNGSDTNINYTASDVNGAFNDGADYNGTSSFTDCGSHNEFEGSGSSISISCWVNAEGSYLVGPPHIASNRTGPSNGWRVWLDGTNIASTFDETNVAIAATYETGVTYHVVVTFDNNTVEAYLDGVSQGTSVIGAKNLATTANMLIGRNHAANGYWNGQIDDFSIWQRVLLSEEVAILASGGAAGACPLNTP